ncbi:hypothetical protein A4G26_04035 [Mycobacterium kansasii]|uniref:Dihydrolipoyl dehydrogenase n=1 Tax=Mycobacterium innocens TaxID=2341083 RepID=A0A498QDD2_9MYCO|nr:hypothetical protein A4G26_04035 [Mycobacterium kansasii]VBA42774.1 Dihydrolipoyl dehydrogenase [Mycobacterium innocens]
MPGTSLSDNVATYEELILSRDLPGSIIIAGSGAVGMKFGYVLTNSGAEMTIAEFVPRALPNEDTDTSKVVKSRLNGSYGCLGLKISCGCR